MAAPAGDCEWCGGPQQWTFIGGDMFVNCLRGCMSLALEGLVSPSVPHSEEGLIVTSSAEKGTILGLEGVPLVGGDSNESALDGCDSQLEPPAGFLDSLWEGGWRDGESQT